MQGRRRAPASVMLRGRFLAAPKSSKVAARRHYVAVTGCVHTVLICRSAMLICTVTPSSLRTCASALQAARKRVLPVLVELQLWQGVALPLVICPACIISALLTSIQHTRIRSINIRPNAFGRDPFCVSCPSSLSG